MAGKGKRRDGIFYDPNQGRVVCKKGSSVSIFWNKEMLDYLRRNFARTRNEDLAEWLGIGHSTLSRKAKELGLRKDRDWLLGIWEGGRRLADIENRRLGYPSRFKKGFHANTGGEYKKGHRLSDEQAAMKSESMRKWYRSHPDKAREKALKAWETRRKNRVAV